MESSTTTRKTFKRINNTTLAYIAGLIDGEGYFTGTLSGCGTSDVKYGAIRVGVVNCRRDVLEWLQGMFGGTITLKTGNPWANYPCFDWRPDETVRLLKLLKPYIRLKRAQLELALAFFSLPHAPEKKRRLALKMRQLNKEQYSRREDIV